MTDDTKLKKLISAILDDTLTEEQAKELDDTLQSSPEAREKYRRMVDIHFTLNEISENKEIVEFSDLPSPEKFPEEFRSTRKQLFFFQALAACMAIAFTVAFFNTKEVIKEVEVVKTVKAKTPLATVASISENIKWKSTAKEEGATIYEEELILEEGEVTLTYKHGAEIKIQGPAHYSLKSLELAELSYGQLAAKVPEAAQGFTVEAPKAAIVDLGTEFAVNVNKQGQSQVYVYEGEVSSSLLNDDGTTLMNASLYDEEGMIIDAEKQTVSELTESLNFIRVDPKSGSQLQVSQEYIKAVKAASPLAYWRFENLDQGRIKNEMDQRFSGKLTHKARIENNTFRVDKGNNGAFYVDELLPAINKEEYTIELWLNAAEHGGEMSLISLIQPEPDSKGRALHLTYSQLMSNKKRLRHLPFDFRFSHRYPATVSTGKNAFAKEAYIPGKWYHFVSVRSKNSFSLYINGMLKQTIEESSNNDELDYRFYMGKIDPFRNYRQFIGSIDEVAIYKKALSLQEIKKHFELLEVK
ncbi:MAG: FecR domain-containing protein [Lentisphaerales bacterium]|nr:FecR domain-containing protein [Lentisphaerales bacterium]